MQSFIFNHEGKNRRVSGSTKAYIDSVMAQMGGSTEGGAAPSDLEERVAALEGLSHEVVDLTQVKADIEELQAREVPSVEGLATEAYVDEKVAEVALPDMEEYVKNEDLTPVFEGISSEFEKYAKKEEIPSVSEFATKTELEEGLAKKMNMIPSEGERMHILLKNNDSLLGKGSDRDVDGTGDLSAGTYNIAMVSKYNVADFGSKELHFGINTRKDVDVTIKSGSEYAQFLQNHPEFCKDGDLTTLKLLKTIQALTEKIEALELKVNA